MRYKTMTEPNSSWWEQLLKWIEGNTVLFLSFAAVWKGIDKAFKYFSESRDDRMREIVKAEMKPLEDKIDDIADAIYNLKIHK